MAAVFWVVLGLLISSIAKLIFWEKAPIAWGPVLLAGVAGAVMGGYAAVTLLPASDMLGFDPFSMLFVIGGAAALVAVFSDVSRRRKRAHEADSRERFRDAA